MTNGQRILWVGVLAALAVGVRGAGAAGPGQEADHKGKITKVDGDAKTISFKALGAAPANEVTVKVGEETKIFVGEAGGKAFQDLKKGMFVRVWGKADEVAAKIVAIDMNAPKAGN